MRLRFYCDVGTNGIGLGPDRYLFKVKHTVVCQANAIRSLFTITFHYVPKWTKNCTEIVHPLVQNDDEEVSAESAIGM